MRIHCDGSRDKTCFKVVKDAHGHRDYFKVAKAPDSQSNNESEYLAIIEAMKFAWSKARHLTIMSDSQLAIEQINGKYNITKPRLKEFNRTIKQLVNGFDTVHFIWIPRGENQAGWILEGEK